MVADPGVVARVDDFRELMSRFPTGVAVVTTMRPDGRPCGMTCSSLVSACLAPPTLLVCLRTDSTTCAAVRARGRFAVNLLGAGGRHAAELFSSARPERFDEVRWELSAAGLPWLLDGGAGAADCLVVDALAVGDHTVVVGEVLQLATGSGPPLLYGLRRFSAWPADG